MIEAAKQRLYHILESGRPEDRLSQIVDWALITLIVANVIAAIAATVEPFYERHKLVFSAFDAFSWLA